jgi:hypothetical protein
MIVARWHVDARFGHKNEVIESLAWWADNIAPQIGWSREKMRMVTGSVGARESRIEHEVVLNDLAELNAAWDRLATIERHRQWSRDMEPNVVSGSMYWEVFRVLG